MKKVILPFLLIFLMNLFIVPNSANAATEITTYSKACILMETTTGKILYEKNANEVRYPASTTKIMTAILTLENCELTDVATVSHNAICSVPPSYSHASLKEGEKLTIEQLLNVLLIPSANDAANVLAEHVSGSVDEFAKLMNEKAKEIGCTNTNFVNPNGVHNKKHVTTAHDLALIGRYAMQNETFRSFVKKTSYTLPTTNKYSKTDRAFVTTNDLLRENHSTAKNNYYYEYTTGVKTGYTSEAGSCIVASAKKDNMEVIAVVLGGSTTSDGLSQRNLDCIHLFDYAFNNYSLKTLNEKNSVLKQVVIPNATRETKDLNIVVKDDISALISNDNNSEIEPKITIEEKLRAPISANTVVGNISYEIDGITYNSDLLAGEEVIASSFFPILIRIVLIVVTLYLLYLLLKPSKKGKHNGKGKEKTSKKGGNIRFTQLINM